MFMSRTGNFLNNRKSSLGFKYAIATNGCSQSVLQRLFIKNFLNRIKINKTLILLNLYRFKEDLITK